MIKIAICDDEAHTRTYLTALIEAQNTPCEITQYASPDDYVSDCAEHDLLFLDIALNPSVQGKSGMQNKSERTAKLRSPSLFSSQDMNNTSTTHLT